MIPASGVNCVYFEPSDSGGVCNHPDMRHGFWIFSYKGNCLLTHEGKVFESECILRVPKIASVTKVIKASKPKPKPKRKALHIHKKHIHKKDK